jgi:hypothetical protein
MQVLVGMMEFGLDSAAICQASKICGDVAWSACDPGESHPETHPTVNTTPDSSGAAKMERDLAY